MRLFKIKPLILTALILVIISIHPSTILAQTVAVTGTITDTQTTPYSNGLLTVTFVNSTGQQATFGGNPSFQKSYAIYLDSNGAFTISLPPNSTASPSIQPAGTQWNFSYQSQGGYGAANINVTITGAGSISGTLSNLARITWPYGNIPPPGAAGQGIVFVSSTTLGWGTTGTAGAVTHTAGNLTAFHLMLGNGIADSTVDSACLTDGIGALSGCTSLTATSDGVHPGVLGLLGNTTAPLLSANNFSIVGPSIVSFAAEGLQFPATLPSTSSQLLIGAASNGLSQATYSTVVPNVTSTTAVTSSNPTINVDQQLIELTFTAGYFNSISKQPYLFQGSGIYTSTAASSPALTFEILLCTISGCGSGTVLHLFDITSGTLNAAGLTNATWSLTGLCTINTTGASGNLICHGSPGLTLNTGALLTSADTVYADTNTAVTGNIDLTAALFVDFTVAQSVAGASNSYTQQAAMVAPPSGASTLAWGNPNVAPVIDPFAPFGWPNTRVTRSITTLSTGAWAQLGETAVESGNANCGGLGFINATAAAPEMCDENTGASANTPAGVNAGSGTTGTIHRTGRAHGIMHQMAGAVNSTTNVRMFRGLTDQTLATMVGADVPAGNYVGIAMSTTGTYTGLTDTTHYVCLTKDNTTQNAVTTAVLFDTAFHYFALWEDIPNSKWHFYIDNAEVCGTGLSSNLPTTATNLRFVDAIQNLTTSSFRIDTAWVATQDDK